MNEPRERVVLHVITETCYYKILGVSKTATTEEITAAYRKLSLRVHPDKNKHPKSEEAFKIVGNVYLTLKNEETRRSYDQFGKGAIPQGAPASSQPEYQLFEEEFGFEFAAKRTFQRLFDHLTEKDGEEIPSLLKTWKSLYPQGMPQLNLILQEVKRFCDGERQIIFFKAYGCALVTNPVKNVHGVESSEDDSEDEESSMYNCRIVFPDSWAHSDDLEQRPQQLFGTYSCGPQKFEECDVCGEVYSRIKTMLKRADKGKKSDKPKHPGLVHAAVCNLEAPIYDFPKKNCSVTAIDIVLSTIAFYVSQTEFPKCAVMIQKALDVFDLRNVELSLNPKDKSTIDSCYRALRKVHSWSKHPRDAPSQSYVLEQAKALNVAMERALQSYETHEISTSEQHVESLLQGKVFDLLPFQFNDLEMSEFDFRRYNLQPLQYSSSSLCYWSATHSTPLKGLPPYPSTDIDKRAW
eukprot:PhF_6_TR19282/c0_g1_i1/m.28346